MVSILRHKSKRLPFGRILKIEYLSQCKGHQTTRSINWSGSHIPSCGFVAPCTNTRRDTTAPMASWSLNCIEAILYCYASPRSETKFTAGPTRPNLHAELWRFSPPGSHAAIILQLFKQRTNQIEELGPTIVKISVAEDNISCEKLSYSLFLRFQMHSECSWKAFVSAQGVLKDIRYSLKLVLIQFASNQRDKQSQASEVHTD